MPNAVHVRPDPSHQAGVPCPQLLQMVGTNGLSPSFGGLPWMMGITKRCLGSFASTP